MNELVQEKSSTLVFSLALSLAPTGIEPMAPSHKRGTFRPEHLRIAWRRLNEGAWGLTQCTVSGPMLKKDGTDSLNRGDRRLSDYRGSLVTDVPNWVVQLVTDNPPPEVIQK